jgi:hypothetical protein
MFLAAAGGNFFQGEVMSKRQIVLDIDGASAVDTIVIELRLAGRSTSGATVQPALFDDGSREFLKRWQERFGNRWVSLGDLVPVAEAINALPVRQGKDGSISRLCLGRFISRLARRQVNGIAIQRMHTQRGEMCRIAGALGF